MNRANQEALFQATNQGLLSIRQSEINYYQSLNVAFGTQAALIGGFTYGVFSQNQINYDNNYENVTIIADIYWVCSAITITLSVHVILCTMLMQVLGPGLALNGPVGSMARATEGMRIEQRQIIVVFIAMMVMFSLSTVLSCWVVMTFEASIGCSIAFAVAACYWYKYCERIYLRFFWELDETGWNKRGDRMEDADDQEPTAVDTTKTANNRLTEANIHGGKARGSQSKRRGVLSYIFGPKRQQQDRSSTAARASVDRSGKSVPSELLPVGTLGSGVGAGGAEGAQSTHLLKRTMTSSSQISDFGAAGVRGGLTVNPNWAVTSASRGVVMEGYLTQRGGGQQGALDFLSQAWERRYFTLTDAACLFIYKTRQDFRNDHKAPIFTRPLRLEDYFIEVNNYDYEARDENDTVDRGSVVASAKHKALFAVNKLTVPDDSDIKPNRFQMTLVLRENVEAAAAMARESVHVLQGDGEVGNPLRAKSLRMERYRDHWVLRCDTEEELQQWVGVMRELCPSCFEAFQ